MTEYTSKVQEDSSIVIRIDRELVLDTLTIDDIVAMEEGNMKATRRILAQFVWDNGKMAYQDSEEGQKVIGKLSLRKLLEISQDFQRGLTVELVPNQSKVVSD